MDSYKDYYFYIELEKQLYEYIEKNDTIQKDSKGNFFSIQNINIIYELLKKNKKNKLKNKIYLIIFVVI
jgi:hypothetical protein